jgi:hypothetical protein
VFILEVEKKVKRKWDTKKVNGNENGNSYETGKY